MDQRYLFDRLLLNRVIKILPIQQFSKKIPLRNIHEMECKLVHNTLMKKSIDFNLKYLILININ